MLRKLFPFLFKSKKSDEVSQPASDRGKKPQRQNEAGDSEQAYGLIASNKSNRVLRRGSRVFVRQILEGGAKMRVRGTKNDGKKVTITVLMKHLTSFKAESIPSHLMRHYQEDGVFKSMSEAEASAAQFNDLVGA